MFLEIIADYSENHENDSTLVNKTQNYWLLKQVVHTVPTRLYRANMKGQANSSKKND
jgi:hypothetical protein